MAKRFVPKPKEKRPAFNQAMLAMARARMQQRPRQVNSFRLPAPAPGVLPQGASDLAMDKAIDASTKWAMDQVGCNLSGIDLTNWSANTGYIQALQEGLAWPGYSYLAELAQRPEYRRLSEITATEMTRKWIKFKSVGEIDKTDRIKELTDEMDRFKVRDHFRKCAELDGFFGRGHLYADTGDTDNPDELKTDIGNGRNDISLAKFKKGMLKGFIPVEPVWTYPTNYNSINPLKKDWYNPNTWFVMGTEIHKSRLLKFVGREVPDLLKPSYAFGGLSMSQMCQPYVNNWLRTRQSVSDLIHSFSVFVLETDLSESVALGGEQLFARLELFNMCRDNRGVMAIQKDSEGFQNVSASLGSLDQLQAQALEQICSVSGIPLVKYTGISPHGLNASSEGEIRVFYDSIHAFQPKLFGDNLTTVIDFCMLNIWGEVDQEITYEYEPLWSLDEKSLAEMQKTKADIAQIFVDLGVISPQEVRTQIAADPDSGYDSLDPDDMPDLREEEEEGLVPEGGGKATAELAGGEAEKEGEIPEGSAKEPGSNEGEDQGELPFGENKILKGDFLKGKNPLDKGYLKGKELDKDHLKGKSPLKGERLKGKNPLLARLNKKIDEPV